MAAHCDIDFVALNGAAGVLGNEQAIAVNVDAAAERDHAGIDRDGAAFSHGGAGLGDAGRLFAAALGARAVERQAEGTEALGGLPDGIRDGQRVGLNDRAAEQVTCWTESSGVAATTTGAAAGCSAATERAAETVGSDSVKASSGSPV